ncbi:MAG: biotin/lipoyl-binding protein, partial [Cyanobacteria bacterium J06573_11]
MTVQPRKRIKPIAVWLSGLIAVGALGSALVLWQQRSQGVSKITDAQTVSVVRQDLASEILAGGLVQAERATNLSPEGSGKISELFIQEGDRVTQGQMIARMVSRRAQAEVAQAEAAVAQAQADLNQRQFGAR